MLQITETHVNSVNFAGLTFYAVENQNSVQWSAVDNARVRDRHVHKVQDRDQLLQGHQGGEQRYLRPGQCQGKQNPLAKCPIVSWKDTYHLIVSITCWRAYTCPPIRRIGKNVKDESSSQCLPILAEA